jgi:hypothetical protein
MAEARPKHSLSKSLSSALTGTTVHGRTRTPSDLPSGRRQTRLNDQADSWKACWGQPLTSSNLVSSASASPGTMSKGPTGGGGGPSTCVVPAPAYLG